MDDGLCRRRRWCRRMHAPDSQGGPMTRALRHCMACACLMQCCVGGIGQEMNGFCRPRRRRWRRRSGSCRSCACAWLPRSASGMRAPPSMPAPQPLSRSAKPPSITACTAFKPCLTSPPFSTSAHHACAAYHAAVTVSPNSCWYLAALEFLARCLTAARIMSRDGVHAGEG